MNRIQRVFAVLLVVLAGSASVCRADGGCEASEMGDGRPFVARAEAAEKIGNFKGALDQLKRMPACASGVNHTQMYDWRKRLARRQGEAEEKQGHFEVASQWYREANSEDDIARVMDKWGKSVPRDRQVFERVFHYFDYSHRDAARLRDFRQIAVRNMDEELAQEDKTFSNAHESLEILQQARQWARYTEGGEKKVNDRYIQRGDALAKDEAPGTFERALRYYHGADAKEREARLRDRALKLADAYEKKGEPVMAAHYYSIAGKSEKSQALVKENLAKEKKDEGARKTKFQKDQKALEKELGF